jgi:hypothetical protein
MAIDGEPVAWTGGHGTSLAWFGSESGPGLDRHGSPHAHGCISGAMTFHYVLYKSAIQKADKSPVRMLCN